MNWHQVVHIGVPRAGGGGRSTHEFMSLDCLPPLLLAHCGYYLVPIHVYGLSPPSLWHPCVYYLASCVGIAAPLPLAPFVY